MAMAHMHSGRPAFAQERGPFKSTLPAADDQASLPCQGFEAHEIAGMGEPVRWKHVREFRWDLLEIPEARRDEYVPGGDRLLVVQRRRKSVVDMLEAMHESGKRLNGLLLLEPRGVAQEEVERDRLSPVCVHVVRARVCLESVHAQWIDMPVPGRSEEHPSGHVGFPEIHRVADEYVIESPIPGVGGHSQAVWTGSNDQQRHLLRHVIIWLRIGVAAVRGGCQA